MKSVFIIKMIYGNDISYPSVLDTQILGYFSELDKAEYYISFPDNSCYWFLEDYQFKKYIIEECGLDYFLLDIRTRIYDNNGKFIGEHLSDNIKGFTGRNECEFKIGDVVEFLSGTKLNIGIISRLPFDKNHVLNINKTYNETTGNNVSILDSSDDCYLVVTEKSHSHPPVHYCFHPTIEVSTDLINILNDRI